MRHDLIDPSLVLREGVHNQLQPVSLQVRDRRQGRPMGRYIAVGAPDIGDEHRER